RAGFRLAGPGAADRPVHAAIRLPAHSGDYTDRCRPGHGGQSACRPGLPAARSQGGRRKEFAMTDVPLPGSREEVSDHEKVSLWRDAMARLRSNRLAVVGMVYVLALVAIAIVGPWLTPYDFLDQNLDIRNAGPSLLHWFGTDDLG